MKIQSDKKNYRKHSQENLDLIAKSLKECGAGRSIIADSKGNIIGGNGTFEEAKKLGIPVKTIETTGEELVCVVRKDIAPDSDKRKRLAVLDNATTDTSGFDFELLQQDFNVDELEDLGVSQGIKINEDEIDSFFKDVEPKEKEPKMVTCPKCGEVFEL